MPVEIIKNELINAFLKKRKNISYFECAFIYLEGSGIFGVVIFCENGTL